MNVAKRSHSIGEFCHRIVLFCRKIIENPDGEMEEFHQEVGRAWAKIEPLSGFSKDYADSWHDSKTEKIDGIFRIIMRNNNNRNARHAYLNALGWNHKILDILIPFQIYENGKWIEGIAVEYKKESNDG